ncbi:MAG: hypothetical protein KF893_27405 [Caldilineaceae bacterium]|nr:hypothetical protein [Caldilineaceae bacterium]
MDKTIASLSPAEFEKMVERTIDRRMQIWLTQILDAMSQMDEEENADFRPEFIESLRRSLYQADTNQGISLYELRKQLGQ